MSTAKIEREMAARGEGCLGKAADDEPVFILRGQDILAPQALSTWIKLAGACGVSEHKLAEAARCFQQMLNYQHTRTSKVPD